MIACFMPTMAFAGITAQTITFDDNGTDATAKSLTYKDAATTVGVKINGTVISNENVANFGTLSIANSADDVVTATLTDEKKIEITPLKAGTANITVSAAAKEGEYSENNGTVLAVTVNPKTVTEPTFDGINESYELEGYTKPTFTLKDGTDTIPTKEYDVTYTPDNPNAAGKVTITVTDKKDGNYTVSGTKTFNVVEKTIPTEVMDAITAYNGVYDGQAHAAVTVGTKAENYTIQYKEETAGDETYAEITKMPKVTNVADSKKYIVKVSKAGYTDNTKEVTPKVTAKDMSNAEIILGDAPVYDGNEKEITITSVKVGELDVTYDVTEGSNKATNVESTTLTLTGKGNFTGSATKVWTLQKATPKAEDFTLPTLNSVVYGTNATVTAPTTAKTGMGDVTVKYNGETTVPTAVGTYTVTFDVADGKNYSAATGLEIGTITITAKQLTIAADATNRAYEAGNKEVDVTLTLNTTGVITDDEVALAATTVKGTMADANVGTGKAVTVTATPELTGAAAGNYTLAAIPAVTVNIAAIDYTGEKAHTEKANAGAQVSCDLAKDFTLPEGYKFGEIVVADADSILEDGTKIVEGKLNFAIKSGAAVGKKATIKIPVTSTNYNNFDIVITAEVAQKSSGSSGGGSYYPYTPSTPSTPSAPGLDKTKTDSTTAINAAATANKYDAAEQAEVKKILDKANADIKNAKTEAEVKAIQEAAQAEIDKILTTEEKAIVAALDNVEKRDFATKSKVITRKGGKKVIRLTWTAPDGVDVDGYEIFRSTKKNSGFGTKPYFETTNTSYTNTKNLKSGKIYYYKVRAFVVINGERVYTDYSMQAFRTIK